ncbi:MAG: hypothetical protein WC678_00640 [Parcubacteria group bacterium]|jgi:hypothetical protein
MENPKEQILKKRGNPELRAYQLSELEYFQDTVMKSKIISDGQFYSLLKQIGISKKLVLHIRMYVKQVRKVSGVSFRNMARSIISLI